MVYVDGVKHSVDHPALLPAFCVVDPILTASLPPSITAHSGLDAFAQAVESVWSVGATDDSVADGVEAAQLASEHLHEAVHAPTPKSRAAMSRASHLAGRAINRTRTTAPHAISYAITSGWGVPHGQAVALTLGPLLEYNAGVTNADCNDRRGAAHVQDRISQILDLVGCDSGRDGNTAIQRFVRSLGCADRLGSVGVQTDDDLHAIASKVNVERLGNNPRRVSHDDVTAILDSVR